MFIDYSTDINDVAQGYRNITTTKVDNQHSIVLFGYSKETGKPKNFVLPLTCSVLYRVKYETNLKDIFGSSLAVKTFSNAFERYKWLDSKGSIQVVQAFKPEEEFLHEQFESVAHEPSFNTQPLRLHFIDIETEVSDVFEKPQDARNRINLITIYDTETEKYYSWALHKVVNTFEDKDKYEIFTFNDNEDRMLRHFTKWFSQNYPDIITGWNTFFYDIPYLVRRIENTIGEDYAKRLSPVGKYKQRLSVPAKNSPASEKQLTINIQGISQLDLLILYRDKFMVRPNLDGGYNLSNVGEAENLGRKLEYEGSIKDFYLRDFQRFYEYNVRDVELTVNLEKKVKLINLARKITSSGLSMYESIYASVGYISGCIAIYAKNHFNTIFPTYQNDTLESESYEGAFVFPCQSGYYNKGIATIDFASLYPNTMISVNLSPETYLGKLLEDYDPTNLLDEYHFKSRNGKISVLTKEQLNSLLDKKCIITKNNTIFLKHEIQWGVVSAWCKHFYNSRKNVKKEMFKLERKVHDDKTLTKDEIETLENEIGNLNNTQLMLKTMINSCYGLFGTIFSPFYNPDLAQTITRQGRFANMSAADYIKKYIKEKYNSDEEDVYVIAGDTDSIFINLYHPTTYFISENNLSNNIREWSDEYKMKFWNQLSNWVENDINPYINNLITTHCRTSQAGVLKYELEYLASGGIYEAKKRYICHKVIEEGMLCDKFKYTGIELKKATVPIQIKDFLKEIYQDTILKNWNEHTYHTYLNNCFDKFKTFPIDSLALWKGYNTAKESVGFLQAQKGAGSHVRALQYYNALIKKLGIASKYPEIILGDKLRFFHINPNNEYGIDVIAYKDQYPKEFEGVFQVDYETMFTKLILQPLKGYEKALNFMSIDPSNQMEEDILSL